MSEREGDLKHKSMIIEQEREEIIIGEREIEGSVLGRHIEVIEEMIDETSIVAVVGLQFQAGIVNISTCCKIIILSFITQYDIAHSYSVLGLSLEDNEVCKHDI